MQITEKNFDQAVEQIIKAMLGNPDFPEVRTKFKNGIAFHSLHARDGRRVAGPDSDKAGLIERWEKALKHQLDEYRILCKQKGIDFTQQQHDHWCG